MPAKFFFFNMAGSQGIIIFCVYFNENKVETHDTTVVLAKSFASCDFDLGLVCSSPQNMYQKPNQNIKSIAYGAEW